MCMPAKNTVKKEKLQRFKSFFNRIISNDKVKYSADFVIVIASYGILLSYSSNWFFSSGFGIKSIIAFGICFYFLKEELPRIITKCFPPKNN